MKMNAGIFLYAFGVWLIFGILTITNGIIRNKYYAPIIGEYPGHVISTIIGIFCCGGNLSASQVYDN